MVDAVAALYMVGLYRSLGVSVGRFFGSNAYVNETTQKTLKKMGGPGRMEVLI